MANSTTPTTGAQQTAAATSVENLTPSTGSAGLQDQLPGVAATVSSQAQYNGGISNPSLIEADVDNVLFRFNSEDTPLMNLMLKAHKVEVSSPEVDHFMIDEPGSELTVLTDVNSNSAEQVVLPLDPSDRSIPRMNCTLLVKGVNGYDERGEETVGRELMLFVVGRDPNNDTNPIVRAVNGRPLNNGSQFRTVPLIPAGTKIVVLANSLYETQKEIDPDVATPLSNRVYLQKRGMNQVVSDYLEHQRKRIPFSETAIAEQAIASFKVRGNRTLWASRAGKFSIDVPKMGIQTIYTTEGVRWQIKREMCVPRQWTVDHVIAMAKMFFTGEDVPQTAILLAGKNLMEAIQRVDYSRHPEIQISTIKNSLGWVVTNFHTVFGDIQIKREPTLDKLGWSNSGALLGDNRLVHYVYSDQHTFEDRVDGQEAKRKGILIWDALALKGNCHIWLDGENSNPAAGSDVLVFHDAATAPASPKTGVRYYLTQNCAGISEKAMAGQVWEYAETAAGDTVWRQCTREFSL